jgi:uncharacterized BrkB/YihY/UPF0761 family membrane protein
MTMVEKLKSDITVPLWFMTMILPLIVTIVLSIIVNIRSQSLINGQVFEMNKRLDRIENKIDYHIQITK